MHCAINFFIAQIDPLIASLPEALAQTNLVCASVNVGSSKSGINMDAFNRLAATLPTNCPIRVTLKAVCLIVSAT